MSTYFNCVIEYKDNDKWNLAIVNGNAISCKQGPIRDFISDFGYKNEFDSDISENFKELITDKDILEYSFCKGTILVSELIKEADKYKESILKRSKEVQEKNNFHIINSKLDKIINKLNNVESNCIDENNEDNYEEVEYINDALEDIEIICNYIYSFIMIAEIATDKWIEPEDVRINFWYC